MGRLEPGLAAGIERIVREKDTAESLRSGLVPVLGTPALVALAENAAIEALKGHLRPGHTTVGGRMDIVHLAPTPVGMRVRARAELLEVEGRRLVFGIEAWDEVERIGEATHERVIVDRELFVAKAEAKST
ncbi:MAG: thioesterase family protein [Anaerolineae bacterium]|jgi:predicted thioesterase